MVYASTLSVEPISPPKSFIASKDNGKIKHPVVSMLFIDQTIPKIIVGNCKSITSLKLRILFFINSYQRTKNKKNIITPLTLIS